MKQLKVAVGSNGVNALGIPTPDSVNGVVLGVATAKSITIPAGATHVLFNATGDFYAKYSGTATVIVDTTDGTGSELNPTLRTLKSTDTISVISPAAANVTACFYK